MNMLFITSPNSHKVIKNPAYIIPMILLFFTGKNPQNEKGIKTSAEECIVEHASKIKDVITHLFCDIKGHKDKKITITSICLIIENDNK